MVVRRRDEGGVAIAVDYQRSARLVRHRLPPPASRSAAKAYNRLTTSLPHGPNGDRSLRDTLPAARDSASPFLRAPPLLTGRLTVRATVSVASPPSPSTSATGIVLVDRSEAEKVNRLDTVYLEKVMPLLEEEFSYDNIHEVPKIDKIVVNCGMGDAEQNSKGLEAAMRDLALITGQMPVKTKANKSIASFKLREGATVGIDVTRRGNQCK
ncbi:hypothetical protein GW17_00028211 [Ensete ventricosum]|nr:hypothetical protein GW17_00028211 [Ensete ventricosum]